MKRCLFFQRMPPEQTAELLDIINEVQEAAYKIQIERLKKTGSFHKTYNSIFKSFLNDVAPFCFVPIAVAVSMAILIVACNLFPI